LNSVPSHSPSPPSQGSGRSEISAPFLAHEVRSALTGILGSIPMLRATPLSTDQAMALDFIECAATHIGDFLTLTLDASKLRAGKLEVVLEAADLGEELESVLKTCGAGARTSGLDLNGYVPGIIPQVSIDRLRFRQILINLVQNAIKFTRKGIVSVRVEHSGEQLITRVTDTGPGMDPDAASRLFRTEDSLYSSSSAQRDRGGTGLGLHLVSEMVAMLRGTIRATSVLGEGMTITCALPAALVQGTHGIPCPMGGSCAVLLLEPKSDTASSLSSDLRTRAVLLAILRDNCTVPYEPMSVRDLLAFDPATITAIFVLDAETALAEDMEGWLQQLPAERRDTLVMRVRVPLLASAVRSMLHGTTATGNPLDPPAEALQGTPPSLRILLAEDDYVSRKLVARQLQSHYEECHVVVVADGEAAVDAFTTALAEGHPFDVVILDANMPKLDGPGAAKRIRAAESRGGRRVGIIALSGHDVEETRVLFRGLADCHLKKPVSQGELHNAIGTLLSAHRENLIQSFVNS